MAKRTAKPAPKQAKRQAPDSQAPVSFTATLRRPAEKGVDWAFLRVPEAASKRFPSRGMVSIEGTLNDTPFAATLKPDGEGGHWLKIEAALRRKTNVQPGDEIHLQIAPATVEPEPTVPPDFKKALAAAPTAAKLTWADITPSARRDWIFWMTSGKKAETRPKRIATACDMLTKGKRRACCFDRSGMYSESLSCPIAEGEAPGER